MAIAGSFPGSSPKHPGKLGNLLKAPETYRAAGRAKSGEKDQAECMEGETQSRAEPQVEDVCMAVSAEDAL